MTDLDANLDATAQAELVRSGEAQPIELVDAAIARIEALNDDLNAVIHPLFDRARAAASGALPDGPFRGVPIVVKDLDGTLAGAPYHAGNKLLKRVELHAPAVTSYIFQKLEAAGFVIVGKANTPEFGLIPSTEPLSYGPTHNPWNLDHSAGGSSGGSAAAVASGLVPVAHAGDGGGSIRIPASMCGLFGLKPIARSAVARTGRGRGVGRARHASRRGAQRARQRGRPRRARGLHDRRPVHRAAARAAVRERGRRRTRAPAHRREHEAPSGLAADRPGVHRGGRRRGPTARLAGPLRRSVRTRRARRGRAHRTNSRW